MKTYNGKIEKLLPNQVFVFGSNRGGFHGAGAAGYASFGESGNVWRKYNYSDKPNGWKGNWNIKGQSSGYQEGTCGKSYAIVTIERPCARRSVSLIEIKRDIKKLYEFARNNSDLEFLIAYSADNNLNGYNSDEMAFAFSGDIPNNVVFEEEFSKLVKNNEKPR